MALGLARTIRADLSLRYWTVELANLHNHVRESNAVIAIFRKFVNSSLMDGPVDCEYSVLDGQVHTGRYHWSHLPSELKPILKQDDPKELSIGQFGMLQSLHWVHQRSVELEPDEVEIDIRCVGVNFRDVMLSMGLVSGAENDLGSEASGVITRVGSNINHVGVGDRVMVAFTSLFTTRRVVPGKLVAPILEALDFAEAAALPVAYFTVLHAFLNVARLGNRESVLIHSACGGVGQAALNIAKMLGAEIYATVGNDEKKQYLVENYGLSPDRIFNSRSTSFRDRVKQATDGRGVDVVLNSLSGDLLHASWECVAKFGRMLEIGKRDILERGHLALDLFEDNRTFHGIDLSTIMRDGQAKLQTLLHQLMQFYNDGHIKPIRDIHTFPAHEVENAFRFMKKGQHIGKIVITMPEDSADLEASAAIEPAILSGSSSYLLVGGMGGIGQAVTKWMVENGARNLVFLSRSAGTSDGDVEFMQELEPQGCTVAAVAGSVVERQDVKRAISAAPTPIAGVLQMSMVLRDRPILNITYDDWQRAVEPEVTGTWNLHNELLTTKLDFFVLFSSMSGALGHPGQANYASASSFMDSFVQYRQRQGLPCSVLDIGVVEGIGYLADKPTKVHQYRSTGLYLLQEEQVIEALHCSIKTQTLPDAGGLTEPTKLSTGYASKSQLGIGLKSTKAVSDPSNRTLLKRDIRFSMYNQLASADLDDTNSKDEGLRDMLSHVAADPEILRLPDTLERVSIEIGRTLFSFMLLPEEDMDVKLTLSAIGVDSLVSIEIRNWWRRSLGVEVTVLEIMNAGTILGLG